MNKLQTPFLTLLLREHQNIWQSLHGKLYLSFKTSIKQVQQHIHQNTVLDRIMKIKKTLKILHITIYDKCEGVVSIVVLPWLGCTFQDNHPIEGKISLYFWFVLLYYHLRLLWPSRKESSIFNLTFVAMLQKSQTYDKHSLKHSRYIQKILLGQFSLLLIHVYFNENVSRRIS